MAVNVLLCSTYELGHQPLALAQPAAHLLTSGFEVQCRDLAVQHLDRGTVEWADVVGISIPMHTAIRLGVRLGQQIKAIKPDVHLCYFGLYASLNANYLLDQGANSIIGGEFEGPLVALVRRLTHGSGPGSGNGSIEGVQSISNVDTLPFLGRQQFLLPARQLLPPLERYSYLEWGDVRKLTGYVEASRGCAHRCLHCPIPAVYEGRVRIVQEEVVLQDIAQLVKMGARHIDFGDPDFLNGVKHSLRIVRRMHEEFPDLTFNFTTKIEHIVQHEEAIREVAGLGCVFITSAVEALSDSILEKLEKGHTEADVRHARQIADEVGIVIRPTLVAFTPWTGVDDYLHVMEVVEELGWIDNIAPIQYAIRLLFPPGSSLLGKEYTDCYLTSFNEELFTYEWRHPDPRMDELYTSVNQLVREAEANQEDSRLTFYRIKGLALAEASGRRMPVETVSALPERHATPRLSEPWFC
jgi:radical SAM superfamily enzyme YgiQ (UPF0313 family)